MKESKHLLSMGVGCLVLVFAVGAFQQTISAHDDDCDPEWDICEYDYDYGGDGGPWGGDGDGDGDQGAVNGCEIYYDKTLCGKTTITKDKCISWKLVHVDGKIEIIVTRPSGGGGGYTIECAERETTMTEYDMRRRYAVGSM